MARASADPAAPPVVEMRKITKRFPGVLANDAVDFVCRAGEIHALLGENGAGKSTLMKILSGLYRPDEGEIMVKGRPARIGSPREALDLGIGMVHQELRLVQSLTVAENIIMGSAGLGRVYSRDRQAEKVGNFASEVGLAIEPKRKVWQLSVGEQQRVEILKVLYRGVNLIVLDEPTALLTPQESEKLFEHLRKIADGGCAIAFITHKLEEVMSAADRITIISHGKTVASLLKSEVDTQGLARLMVGELPARESNRGQCSPGDQKLDLREVHALGDHKQMVLKGVSLSFSCGEILGLAGVAGNGQRELAEVIAGLRNVEHGKILMGGKRIDGLSPREIIKRGLGYIPEDRLGVGVVSEMSVADNLSLKDFDGAELSGRFFLRYKQLADKARDLVATYGIKAHDVNLPVGSLSGGNIQRVILAREISRNPRFLLAVNPTRGLDIGAADGIHRFLDKQRADGRGVLLMSEDLDELFRLSDRIAVIFQGRIAGIVSPERGNLESIGMMMGGAR